MCRHERYLKCAFIRELEIARLREYFFEHTISTVDIGLDWEKITLTHTD
jgi:hypothetical protein